MAITFLCYVSFQILIIVHKNGLPHTAYIGVGQTGVCGVGQTIKVVDN